MIPVNPADPVPYVNAALAGIYSVFVLRRWWPYDFAGRRRNLNLKQRDRDYE